MLSPDIGEISDWFLVGLLLPAMVRVLEPGFVFCPEAEADWFLVGLRLPAMVPVLVPGFELCPEGKVTISVSGAGGSVWISHQGHRHRPLVFPPSSRIGFLQIAGVLESSGDATGTGDVLPGNCLIKLASMSDLGVRLVSASTWLLPAG